MNEDYQVWTKIWINWINNRDMGHFKLSEDFSDLSNLQSQFISLPEEVIIKLIEAFNGFNGFNGDNISFNPFYDILILNTNFTQPPPIILVIGVAVTLFNIRVFNSNQYEEWYGYTLLFLENLIELNKNMYGNFEIKNNEDFLWKMYVLEDIIPSMEKIFIYLRIHFKELGILSSIEKNNRPFFS